MHLLAFLCDKANVLCQSTVLTAMYRISGHSWAASQILVLQERVIPTENSHGRRMEAGCRSLSSRPFCSPRPFVSSCSQVCSSENPALQEKAELIAVSQILTRQYIDDRAALISPQFVDLARLMCRRFHRGVLTVVDKTLGLTFGKL